MTSDLDSTLVDQPGQDEPDEISSVDGLAEKRRAKADEAQTPEEGCARLPRPPETNPIRIAWGHTIGISSVHLFSLLAFLPWFFSWTGVTLAIAGHFFFGLLGITLCYHRVLTHRGMVLPKWLEHFFATLGVCCLQDSPARWVAIHRMHHKDSDKLPDPHSPLVNFFWGHMGWLFVKHGNHSEYLYYENYARDVLRDRFYVRFESHLMWMWTYVFHAVLFYLVGLGIGWATTGQFLAGVQFGSSLLIWGVFVRTVLVWHLTWSVNSIAHVWGYQNYDTRDDSRNNWLVGLLTHGEGWHNNHHADQRSARHGHRWFELDCTWLVVLFLERVGLAKEVVRPRSRPDTDVVGH